MILGLEEPVFAELFMAFVLAIVLIATLVKQVYDSKYKTKMDYIQFYNNLDTKLRDTDKELRKEEISEDEQYHNMVQIIITVTNIIRFQDKLNSKYHNPFRTQFDLEYFRGWIKYGYALTDHLGCKTHKDADDDMIAQELIEWCVVMNKKEEGQWTKKNPKELPQNIICSEETEKNPEEIDPIGMKKRSSIWFLK